MFTVTVVYSLLFTDVSCINVVLRAVDVTVALAAGKTTLLQAEGSHPVLHQGHKGIQFSSVQFSSVQFSSVQFSSVQFSSVQFSSVQFSSVQFSSVQFSSVQFSSVQFNLFQNTQH